MADQAALADPKEAPDEKKAAPREQPKDEQKPRRSLGPVGWIILAIILVGAGIGGTMLWNYLQSYEETDDAQIDGDIYAVTSRIGGTIKAVYVQDNQSVKAGQLLAELDPADYQVAVEQARASVNESRTQVAAVRPNVSITTLTTESTVSTSQVDIAAARATVAAAQRDYESAVAQIRQAEADQIKAQADLARYKQLIAKDEISRQQFDQVQAAANSLAALTDVRKAGAEAAARTWRPRRRKCSRPKSGRWKPGRTGRSRSSCRTPWCRAGRRPQCGKKRCSIRRCSISRTPKSSRPSMVSSAGECPGWAARRARTAVDVLSAATAVFKERVLRRSAERRACPGPLAIWLANQAG